MVTEEHSILNKRNMDAPTQDPDILADLRADFAALQASLGKLKMADFGNLPKPAGDILNRLLIYIYGIGADLRKLERVGCEETTSSEGNAVDALTIAASLAMSASEASGRGDRDDTVYLAMLAQRMLVTGCLEMLPDSVKEQPIPGID